MRDDFLTMWRRPQHLPLLLLHCRSSCSIIGTNFSWVPHSKTSLVHSAAQGSPLPTCKPTRRRTTKIVVDPAVTDAILRKLDGIGFGRQILTKGSGHQILFDACWAKVQLLLDEGVAVTEVKKSIKQHPNVLFATSEHQLGSIVRLLNSVGIAGQSLGKILLRKPQLLRKSAEILEHKISSLEILGIERKFLKASFVNFPTILGLRIEKVAPRIQYLRDIGVSEQGITKIFRRNPRLFYLRLDYKVKPVVTYLQGCGLAGDHLGRAIACRSVVFGCSPLALSKRRRFFRQLGLEENSIKMARAILWLCTFGTDALQKKVDFLRTRGFSSDEIGKMVRDYPLILALHEENMSVKMDYVAKVLKRDIKELVKYPAFLALSLEKRIIPRFNALAKGQEAGLKAATISLNTVTGASDVRFQIWLLKTLSRNRHSTDEKTDPSKHEMLPEN